VEHVLPGGLATSGRGEEVGKGCGRVNIVQLLCTHVCEQKKEEWNTLTSYHALPVELL
jgi:hypothetical protein